jgi:pentatricopeptide repeat protein
MCSLPGWPQMLQEGLQPNLVTYNTLLEVYAKRGMWGKAVGVLDTLEQQVRGTLG